MYRVDPKTEKGPHGYPLGFIDVGTFLRCPLDTVQDQPSHSLLIHMVRCFSLWFTSESCSSPTIHPTSGICSSHQRILHPACGFSLDIMADIHTFIHTCAVMVERVWLLKYVEMNLLSETVSILFELINIFKSDISSVECYHSVFFVLLNNPPADSFSFIQPTDGPTAGISQVLRAGRSPPISSWLGALCIL